MPRKKITLCFDDVTDDNGEAEINIPAVRLIAALQDALDGTPPEFRDALVLNISASGDYAFANVSLEFTRLETDEEMRLREAEEWATSEAWQRRYEAEERAQLAKLKAKYENSRT